MTTQPSLETSLNLPEPPQPSLSNRVTWSKIDASNSVLIVLDQHRQPVAKITIPSSNPLDYCLANPGGVYGRRFFAACDVAGIVPPTGYKIRRGEFFGSFKPLPIWRHNQQPADLVIAIRCAVATSARSSSKRAYVVRRVNGVYRIQPARRVVFNLSSDPCFWALSNGEVYYGRPVAVTQVDERTPLTDIRQALTDVAEQCGVRLERTRAYSEVNTPTITYRLMWGDEVIDWFTCSRDAPTRNGAAYRGLKKMMEKLCGGPVSGI